MRTEIIDYSNVHKGAVRALFLRVYPTRPEVADQMTYDVDTAGHIATKLARIGERVVGQAGVFWLADMSGVAGMGYHVDPDFRRMGVGAGLAKAVLADAEHHGVEKVIVRTSPANAASLALAGRLGFQRVGDSSATAGAAIELLKELRGRTSSCSRRRTRRG